MSSPWAVKYPLGRAIGYGALSWGLWTFYWFHRNRRLLDGETGRGRDDATLHTLGLLVPVLNAFIVYWVWRDVDELRRRFGLSEFPVVPFVVGAVFLPWLFYCLVLPKVNELWDVRTQGLAVDAETATAEKVILAAGGVFWLLWALAIVLALVLAVAGGS